MNRLSQEASFEKGGEEYIVWNPILRKERGAINMNLKMEKRPLEVVVYYDYL